MKLNEGDKVVNASVIVSNTAILVVSEFGYGKKTALSEYKTQNRGGKGVITLNVTPKTGKLVAALQVTEEDNLVIITNLGKLIRMATNTISTIGRNTQGVKLINVDEGELVVSAAKVMESSDDEEMVKPVGEETKEKPIFELDE